MIVVLMLRTIVNNSGILMCSSRVLAGDGYIKGRCLCSECVRATAICCAPMPGVSQEQVSSIESVPNEVEWSCGCLLTSS